MSAFSPLRSSDQLSGFLNQLPHSTDENSAGEVAFVLYNLKRELFAVVIKQHFTRKANQLASVGRVEPNLYTESAELLGQHRQNGGGAGERY